MGARVSIYKAKDGSVMLQFVDGELRSIDLQDVWFETWTSVKDKIPFFEHLIDKNSFNRILKSNL